MYLLFGAVLPLERLKQKYKIGLIGSEHNLLEFGWVLSTDKNVLSRRRYGRDFQL